MSALSLEPYRHVLARPALRRALVLGVVVRLPVFATGVIVTIHVVTELGRSYAEAGVVGAAATLSMAVSAPWRGRLLDRYGLRRVVGPSIVVSGVCWAVAPWAPYWALLVLVTVAGLFLVPIFSLVRQAIIAASAPEQRRTAISLDTSLLEVSFMIAPAVAVAAATQWGTTWVIFVNQMLGVAAGLAVWMLDPPLRGEQEAGHGRSSLPWQAWVRGPFVVACSVAAVATVVLAGSDISFIATMRDLDSLASVGIVLAVWGLGSLVGGLVYGAASHEVPSRWLLVGLAVTAAPMALATSVWTLCALAFVAGLLCAPTIAATVDEISRMVPAERRGEAMGWHGGSMTVGGALGAPFAGAALDRFGVGSGFLAVAAVGLVIGLAAQLAPRVRAEAVEETADAAPGAH